MKKLCTKKIVLKTRILNLVIKFQILPTKYFMKKLCMKKLNLENKWLILQFESDGNCSESYEMSVSADYVVFFVGIFSSLTSLSLSATRSGIIGLSMAFTWS